MDGLIATLGGSLGAEALKSWGVFASLLALLGFMLWRKDQEIKAEKAETKELRAQLSALQDRRLEDAQKLIRVAETGTATMASRSEGDQRFAEVMKDLVDEMTEIKARLPPRRRDAR